MLCLEREFYGLSREYIVKFVSCVELVETEKVCQTFQAKALRELIRED